MLNKFAFLVIAGLGASVGVNVLDGHLNGPDTRQSAIQSQPATQAVSTQQRVVAISAGSHGQFTAATLINGVHVEMLADTGATNVLLTAEDAERIGLDLEWLNFDIPTLTANGKAMVARIILDEVSVGGIKIRDVRAAVAQPGMLHISLLGMTYLGKLAKFEIKGDQLILYR